MPASLKDVLEAEHRDIDLVLEAFAAGAGDANALRTAVALLRRHIYFEEISLFPPLRSAGMFGPVLVMEHEHGLMWPVLDQIEQALDAEDTSAAAELCGDVLQQLAAHNVKEEQILYVQAEALLTAAQLSVLRAGLDEAEVPDGWTSAGVRD